MHKVQREAFPFLLAICPRLFLTYFLTLLNKASFFAGKNAFKVITEQAFGYINGWIDIWIGWKIIQYFTKKQRSNKKVGKLFVESFRLHQSSHNPLDFVF